MTRWRWTGTNLVLAGHEVDPTLGHAILARYQPGGDFDSTFAHGGLLEALGATSRAEGRSLAIQPDGKLVVAGAVATYCSAYCDWDAFGVARYDAAGTLDPAFGTGGHVTITFARGAAEGYGVAIEPDGKIVVAGYAGSGTDGAFALARLLPDGTPDAGFGTNGQVITDIDPDFRDAAFALLRQPDGKIVAGGYTPYSGWALARYLPNGSLDSTFGNQGIVETLIGDNTAYLFSLALQADGKILAGGQASPSCTDTCPPGPFALARYLPDGTLDSTFGSGGIVQTIMSPAGDSRVYGLAVQPDGRILAGGPAGLNCWDPGLLAARLRAGALYGGRYARRELRLRRDSADRLRRQR